MQEYLTMFQDTFLIDGTLVIRGEAIIPYSYFYKMNEEIEDVDSQYKNPRNLCSGSVRQLNNEITAKRHVHFYAFSVSDIEGMDFNNSFETETRLGSKSWI